MYCLQEKWVSDLVRLPRVRHGISNALNSDTIPPCVYGVYGVWECWGLNGKNITLKATYIGSVSKCTEKLSVDVPDLSLLTVTKSI